MRTIIIGGGAAGMMAAYSSKIRKSDITSSENDEVILIEKNEKLGKKIFITGKGRGNITNNCDKDKFFSNIIHNPKFFNSSFAKFSNFDTMNFFIDNGLKLKTERGDRVFPFLDKAYLITDTFKKILNKYGVKIFLNSEVIDIDTDGNIIKGVKYKDLIKNKINYISADKVIIATGGLSYSSTGSTGDGYKFSKKLGIKINELYPALVPLKCSETNRLELLKGLKLKNISVKFFDLNKKLIYKDFGELYFENDFLDGPVIRKASSILNDNTRYLLSIDLKPALDVTKIDKRVIREIQDKSNSKVIDVIRRLLPEELSLLFVKELGFDIYSNKNSIDKEKRIKLVNLLKNFDFNIIGNMGFDYAIITRGGVDVKEINPSTMESKRIKGLYFAGEVIDIDAFTGGYNMQIAFSTGYLAGVSYGI